MTVSRKVEGSALKAREACEVKGRAGAREVASFATKDLLESDTHGARGNYAAKGVLIERAWEAGGQGSRERFRERVFAWAFSESWNRKTQSEARGNSTAKGDPRLYGMLCTQKRYPEIVSIESSSRVALVGASQPQD